jgi:hypothetical protein
MQNNFYDEIHFHVEINLVFLQIILFLYQLIIEKASFIRSSSLDL